MKIQIDPYRKNKLFKTCLLDTMYRDPNEYSIQQYHFTHRDTYLYIDYNKRFGVYMLIGTHFSEHHFNVEYRANDYLYMTDYNLKNVVSEYDFILLKYMEFRNAMY